MTTFALIVFSMYAILGVACVIALKLGKAAIPSAQVVRHGLDLILACAIFLMILLSLAVVEISEKLAFLFFFGVNKEMIYRALGLVVTDPRELREQAVPTKEPNPFIRRVEPDPVPSEDYW